MKGVTIWLTGLSGSGKSTVSHTLQREIEDRGFKIEVLDGDVIRQNFCKGLGFSKEDRDENIRRIAFVCHLLTRNNVPVIAAAISPYREIRDEARKLIGDFVEIYVKCPVNICMDRDVKGLYKKAIAGEISNFTGVSDPYEEPQNPDLILETDKETPAESVAKIIDLLELRGYLPVIGVEDVYSDEEEEKITQRLADLGYL